MTALDHLRALCDAATPGNWFVAGPTHLVIATRLQPNPHNGKRIATTVVEDVGGKVQAEYNASFIAAARTALPALMEYVEALEWERECKKVANQPAALPLHIVRKRMGQLTLTRKAATAAVEAARAKLEATL